MRRSHRHYSRRTPLFDADVRAAGRWGLVAGAACVLEHIFMWPLQDRWGGFARYVPYLVGTGTLTLAFAGWARERGLGRAVVGLAGITALGGAATIGAYRVHAWWAGTEEQEASVGDAHSAFCDYVSCQQ